MLNLINLLTDRPAPTKGARLVKGYAMSGSPSGNSTHQRTKDEYLKAVAKTQAVIRRRRESRKKEILGDLKEWKSIQNLASELGFSGTNTALLVKELREEGKVKSEKRGSTTYYARM